MKKYTGKYPWRIKQVSGIRRGVVVVTSNDGRTAEVSAKDTGGRMPEIGDDIRDYSLGVMTVDDDGTVHQNPRGKNPLKRVRVMSPPQRPKGTTAKPSKRLVARRKATKKAPEGYYANPRAEKSVLIAVKKPRENSFKRHASFSDYDEAVIYARALHDAHPSWSVKVGDKS